MTSDVSGTNNPMNVRRSDIPWQGKVAGGNGPFEDFDTPQDGIRAGLKTFLAKFHQHGARTIYEAIKQYAPPEQNPTRAYAEYVAGYAGVGADDPIDPDNLAVLEKIGEAMCWFESKSQFALDIIKAAAASALGIDI
jgi:hypothetical protein